MSRWYEPIDRRPGATPIIRASPGEMTFELAIVGMRDQPARKPRVFIRCRDDGTITVKLLAGRSSAV